MTDPQPHHLKEKPRRAEPWQPDKPGADVDRVDADAATPDQASASGESAKTITSSDDAVFGKSSPGNGNGNGSGAGQGTREPVESAVSSEARIRRDPMTGQALDDESLVSGKDSERSDGRSGSTHVPES